MIGSAVRTVTAVHVAVVLALVFGLSSAGVTPDVMVAESWWYAFLAAPLDEARDCTWQWQPDEELFRAACDESLTAPADGEGLPQFKVTVRDGRLDVDLNADARGAASSTTTSPAD